MVVDSNSFKEALAHWASGVTVLTSVYDGQLVGMTASSFCSVSLEPPRVLVCVSRKALAHTAVEQSGIFAVNILDKRHLEWGMRFAGQIPGLLDRFAGIDYITAETGAPILPSVNGWLDCRVAFAYDGGDHTIFVGDVVACAAQQEGDPLLYYHRHWRRLDDESLQLPLA